jgi:hypothetical protein
MLKQSPTSKVMAKTTVSTKPTPSASSQLFVMRALLLLLVLFLLFLFRFVGVLALLFLLFLLIL